MSEKDVVLDADGLSPAKTVFEIAEEIEKYGTGPRSYEGSQEQISAISALLGGKSPEEIQELLAPKGEQVAPSGQVPGQIGPSVSWTSAEYEELLKSPPEQFQEALYRSRKQKEQDLVNGVTNSSATVTPIKAPEVQVTQVKAPEAQGPLDELGEVLEMQDASNIKIAQMVWKMALAKGRESEGIKAVSDKLGQKAKDILPLTLGNVALSADASKVVMDTYPDLTGVILEAAALNPGRNLMAQAGYDEATINKIPQDVLDHWAISDMHDASFETPGPNIVDRLKQHKATIFEALGNDHVQRSLKWAGLIVGCATGGIVAKVGVKGIAFLAEKLGENPKVVELAKTLEDKSIKFVSQTFKIDEAKVREKVEVAKGFAEQLSNSKWATAAKVAAMVGLGVALGNLDFVHDAAMTVAGHTASLAGAALDGATVAADAIGHSAAVAGEYVATGGTQILHAAAEATGAPGQFVAAGVNQIVHGAAVAGEFVATGAGQILYGAAVAAGATGEFVATGAGQILHGAGVAAEFTGDVIVDAGHATVEAAGIVKDAVVEGAVATQQFAVDTVHSIASGTAEGLRVAADIADPSIADHVASAADRAAVENAAKVADSFAPTVNDLDTDVNVGLGAADDQAVQFPTDPVGSTAPDATAAPAPAPAPVSEPAPGPTVVEVKHGDSLWKIAERHLEANGGQASNTEIQNLVNRIYEDNKGVIGSNPNLIFDHQSLVIDHPSVDASPIAAGPVYHGPHHVPHPAVPTEVVHEHGHKAAVDMLQTEALPNGTPAQVSKYMDLITQRERVDDGPQIS